MYVLAGIGKLSILAYDWVQADLIYIFDFVPIHGIPDINVKILHIGANRAHFQGQDYLAVIF